MRQSSELENGCLGSIAIAHFYRVSFTSDRMFLRAQLKVISYCEAWPFCMLDENAIFEVNVFQKVFDTVYDG